MHRPNLADALIENTSRAAGAKRRERERGMFTCASKRIERTLIETSYCFRDLFGEKYLVSIILIFPLLHSGKVFSNIGRLDERERKKDGERGKMQNNRNKVRKINSNTELSLSLPLVGRVECSTNRSIVRAC